MNQLETTFVSEAALNVKSLSILRRYSGLQNVRIINGKENPYKSVPGLNYTPDAPLRTSILGTPIYTDLTILGGQWFDTTKPMKPDGTYPVTTLPNDRSASGNSENSQAGNSSSIDSFYMQFDTVLISVSQAVEVEKTKIQGRNGKVKEYIGLDDAQLAINGIITGKNGVYPRGEVYRLKQWLDAPISKGVVAWWLQNMGIDNVVVDNYSFPQTPGGYSYQVFTINASSDMPIAFYVNQPLQNS